MNKNGIALVIALMAISLIGAVSTLMFSRTVTELKHSASNASIVQTLMMARGTANAGGVMLTGPIRDKLMSNIIKYYNPSGAWAFGNSATVGASQPDPASVANDFDSPTSTNDVLDNVQLNINDELCTLNLPSEEGATVTLRMFFTTNPIEVCNQIIPFPHGVPLGKPRYVSGGPRNGIGDKKGQVYAIPFVMVSEAKMGQYRRNIVIQGEYEFDATVSSFARFALFTNKHESPDGSPIWFTERTKFQGPVHTNQNFRFYRNPQFGEYVSSAGCTNPGPDGCLSSYTKGGIFYGVNNNNVIKNPGTKPSYTNSYGTHAPKFNKTVDWNASFIKLPKESINMIDRANERGLMINSNLHSLTLFAGDDTGNPVERISGDTYATATFQYIRACTDATTCTLYRFGTDKKPYKYNGATWEPLLDALGQPIEEFNGMVYVNGNIAQMGGPPREDPAEPERAGPALAAFADITVANAGAGNGIKITSDLKYESLPCPEAFGGQANYTCTNMDAKNVLGVYSQDGDILLGDGTNSSLQDLTVHGVLMASTGTVAVDNYKTITPRGNINLLGGIIENSYGGFGTFNSSSGTYTSGYGREFTYDKRMASGVSPPYFPGTDVANNGARVRSFGQREQVY
jgi:hypothetical protein